MRRLPWRIVAEWMRYAQEEPFGELRADLRAGQIIAWMANMWAGKKAKNITPATIFPSLKPFFDRARAAQRYPTPEELLSKMLMANLALGGSVIHKDDLDA